MAERFNYYFVDSIKRLLNVNFGKNIAKRDNTLIKILMFSKRSRQSNYIT